MPSARAGRRRWLVAANLATADVKLPAGFAVYAVRFGDLHSAAEEITQYAADVVVLEPAELRDFVVRGLTAVAESVSAA